MIRWFIDRWHRLTNTQIATPSKSDAASAALHLSSPSSDSSASTSGPSAIEPPVLQPRQASFGLGVLAVVFALVGQIVFFNQLRDLVLGSIFYGLATLSFLSAIRLSELTGSLTIPLPPWMFPLLSRISRAQLPSLLIACSLILTVVVVQMIRQPDNDKFVLEAGLWLANMALFAVAFVRVSRSSLADVRVWLRIYRVELGLVLLLTLVASALRFVTLGDLPEVLSGDEGTIGMLAAAVSRGEITNMLGTLYGHSTLYIFIMSWGLNIFGMNAMALRLTSAIAGTLAIPAMYSVARYMFGKRVALLSTVLLTVSHIHLHFSRIIVAGSIQDVLFSSVIFFFLISGLEKRSAPRLMLSGLILGFFLHIYMGSRLLVMFVPIYLAFLLIVDRKMLWDNRVTLLAFVGGLVVSSAPMATWAWMHPEEFMVRANQVGVFQSGWLFNESKVTGQSELQILIQLLIQAFLTVTYYQASGFYNAEIPMLDFLSGIAFMLGLAYSLSKVWNARHLLLQGWFWSAVVVGGALVVLPANAAYRILIALPAVCIFVALGWDQLLKLIQGLFKDSRYVPLTAAVLIMGGTAFINLRYYFVEYTSACLYEDWGTRYASTMGKYMAQSGKEYMTYLAGAPRIYYGIHNSVDFLSNKMKVKDLNEPITDPAKIGADGKTLFFFTPQREAEFEKVKAYFPGGEEKRFSDCRETIMIVYRVDTRHAP